MKKNGVLKFLAVLAAVCLLAACVPAPTATTTTAGNTTTTVTTAAPTTTMVPTTTTTTVITTTVTKPPVRGTVDLMKSVKAAAVEGKDADDAFSKAQWEFALKLFKQANKEDDDNVLVSPLSAQLALAMMANGAKGSTKTQIEAVLGMKAEDYNRYASSYIKSIQNSENATMTIANSLWVKRGLTVKKNFLQTNADYYGADVFQADFDKKTLQDMNNWVKEKTGGLINEVEDDLAPNVELSVFNTVAFDAKWLYPFKEEETAQGVFTTADGKKQTVDFMTSNSEMTHIADSKAQGFIKSLHGSYAMVFLMPNEGITLEQYISGLTADGIKATMKNKTDNDVWTMLLPKFRFDYDVDLKDTMQQLGVRDLFEPKADLSGIAKGLYVSEADQKTMISVNEHGATAAAVSRYNAIRGIVRNYLALDRPFVYMIIDYQATENLPIFIGTVTEIE